MSREPILLLLSCMGVVVALEAQPTHACSGVPCAPDQFLPRGGSVPANIAAVAWWPGHAWLADDAVSVATKPSDLRFACEGPSGSRSIAVDVELEPQGASVIRPRTTLVAGEQCTLHAEVSECDIEAYAYSDPGTFDGSFLDGRAELRIDDSAPLPAALGRLQTTAAERSWIELAADASCSSSVETCVIRAELEFGTDALPWRDAFVYETWVDGKRWRVDRSLPLPLEEGGSYEGRGKELFFSTPGGAASVGVLRGLAKGRHTVVMKAALPGTDVALTTAPITIDLSCPSVPREDSDAAVGGEDSGADDSAASNDAGGCSVMRLRRHALQGSLLWGLAGISTLLVLRLRVRSSRAARRVRS
jgi:hypothetical protein